jgi:hypothetical protein
VVTRLTELVESAGFEPEQEQQQRGGGDQRHRESDVMNRIVLSLPVIFVMGLGVANAQSPAPPDRPTIPVTGVHPRRKIVNQCTSDIWAIFTPGGSPSQIGALQNSNRRSAARNAMRRPLSASKVRYPACRRGGSRVRGRLISRASWRATKTPAVGSDGRQAGGKAPRRPGPSSESTATARSRAHARSRDEARSPAMPR